MAKRPKSPTILINGLVNALGEEPKPGWGTIRNDLITLASLVQELEEGETARQLETQIASLEAALEESNAENGNLKAELQKANAVIEAVWAEEKEREKKEQEIPDIQFEILKRLPSEHSGIWLKISEIAYGVGIPVDEAEIHLDRLQRASLVTKGFSANDAVVYHRNIRGTEFVVALRLADEGNESGKPRQHADLMPIQQEALLLIARNAEGITEAELVQRVTSTADSLAPSVLLFLTTLRTRGFVAEGGSCGSVSRLDWRGRCLVLAKRGAEYLSERDLL
jgi:hypothetical protein